MTAPIPRELHESADLEGLGAWARLRMLILPQLAPVLALNLVLITIQTLNTFDLILPLTGGGPARRTEVISLFMYRAAFYDPETGRAAAAILLLAITSGWRYWPRASSCARGGRGERGATSRHPSEDSGCSRPSSTGRRWSRSLP